MIKNCVLSLLSVLLFSIIGYSLGGAYNTTYHYDSSIQIRDNSITEELNLADIIIKGKVIEEKATEKRKSDLPGGDKFEYFYDVTPAVIHVEEVIQGEVNARLIEYLQHGSPSSKDAATTFLKAGEEVILFLNKTSDNKYWSYDYNNGIWKIEDGVVTSDAHSPSLLKYKEKSGSEFIKDLKRALD